MNIHNRAIGTPLVRETMARARLTPVRREEMALAVISGRLSKAQAARVYGLSARIVSRWTERYRAEGPSGMQDRSSRPQVILTQTAEAASDAHHHAPPEAASAVVTLQN